MVIINGALPGRLSEFNSYGNGRYIYISSPKLDEMGQNMTITENSLAHAWGNANAFCRKLLKPWYSMGCTMSSVHKIDLP